MISTEGEFEDVSAFDEAKASNDEAIPFAQRFVKSKMRQTITISLPDDTRSALDDAAQEEGMSKSALIEKALSDYLFFRRFRRLRERVMSQGKPLPIKTCLISSREAFITPTA